jgi:hypothetical protein
MGMPEPNAQPEPPLTAPISRPIVSHGPIVPKAYYNPDLAFRSVTCSLRHAQTVVVVVVVLRTQTCRAKIGELPLSIRENVSNYRPVVSTNFKTTCNVGGVCLG